MKTDSLRILVACTVFLGACEAADNVNSEITCQDYCDNKYDCEMYNPTSSETAACVDDCRMSIENDCGNNHQDDANDRLAECNDMSCDNFYACLVFDSDPTCFEFVNN